MSGQRSISVFYSVIAWNRYESAHGWRGCRKFSQGKPCIQKDDADARLVFRIPWRCSSGTVPEF